MKCEGERESWLFKDMKYAFLLGTTPHKIRRMFQ